MKKYYLMIFAALTVTSAAAQDVAVGVKGGLTVPNITPGGRKTPLSEGYSSRPAWGAGAFAELRITNTFSIQAGLEYSGQGGKKNGVQALPSELVLTPLKAGMEAAMPGAGAMIDAMSAAGYIPGDYIYADIESKAGFDYLMLPVQAKFGWDLGQNSPWRAYFSAGLFCSYLLKAERVATGKSPFYANARSTAMMDHAMANGFVPNILDESSMLMAGILSEMDIADDKGNTRDITDEIRDFNFGFIGSVGLSYKLAGRHTVFIEGGGNYGFVKIQKSDANGRNRIGAGTVMLGYSYRLGK